MKLLFAAAAVAATMFAPAAMAAYPDRPINIIVPAGAGGGTDVTARLLALGLEQKLGQPINVVNQGQGGGVVGFDALISAAPDGYTLGVIFNFAHYKALGQGNFDAANLTPISQFNFDPAGFHVPANSSWTSIKQALDDIKADPGKYNYACGGGCGGSWPLAFASLLKTWDVDLSQVRMISGQSSVAALQEMVAGGFDVVPSSVPEAGTLIQAKLVRGLAVFGKERLAAFPEIPTLLEETGLDLELGAWRGLVAPAGLPDDIKAKLETAVKEVYESADFQKAMQERGFGLVYKSSADFGTFMQSEETSVRELIPALGL